MPGFVLAIACCLAAAGPDWPQFEGPRRENKSADTGLLKSWPEEGPQLLWRAAGIGRGFSSVAIGRGRIYTAGQTEEDTIVTALDLDGQTVWQARNGPAYQRSPAGSRGTPTLDGPRLYHLSGNGHVICLDAGSGKSLWTLNMVERFGGRVCQWGLSESLLIDGRRLICCPGGQQIAMAAVDKETGRTIWECRGAGDPPSYASAILVEHGGLRQIVTMTAESAIGVAAETGSLLWRYEREAPYDVNATTPVYHEGHVAIFTTWGRGATLLKLNVVGQNCTVEKVWHTADLDNEHGGVILLDGYLYGLADGGHKQRRWACIEWRTGKTMYQTEPLRGSTATLTWADGMFYLVGPRGEVTLQRPDPREFKIVSQFTLPKGGEGAVWARPVVCGGRLYVRHGDLLYAYDVRAPR